MCVLFTDLCYIILLIHGDLSVMNEKNGTINPYGASFLEESLWQFWHSLTKS